MTFEWPPIHSFPPFFTRQANDSVWEEQRLLWQSMVLRYAQHNRLWRMSISELLQSDLFFNRSLNRGLKLETAIEIVQNLVRSGNAEWVSGSNSTAIYIYWYRAEEWAELIAQWVNIETTRILIHRLRRPNRRILCSRSLILPMEILQVKKVGAFKKLANRRIPSNGLSYPPKVLSSACETKSSSHFSDS